MFMTIRVRNRRLISFLFFNFVSYPPDRCNDLVLSGVLLHLAAKPSDMYHNRVICLVDFLIPHLLKDFIGAEDPPGLDASRYRMSNSIGVSLISSPYTVTL